MASATAMATATSTALTCPPRTFTQSITRYRQHFSKGNGDEHDHEHEQDSAAVQLAKRKENAASMADEYYDFATPAFLANWSRSIHYAPFSPQHETLREAQTFYEHRLAVFLQLQPNDLVLDVGCGVGAPAMEIARLTGCRVVGVSINQRQVDIARAEARRQRLAADDDDNIINGSGNGRGQCTFVRADFNNLPFADDSFDAAYAIEATCHAADLSVVYKEIARVVKKQRPDESSRSSSSSRKKPSCVISEWLLTPAFDPANAEHVRVRERIERSNGLPRAFTLDQARRAFCGAGFELTHSEDYSRHFDYAYGGGRRQQQQQQPYRPWYQPIDGTLSSLSRSSSPADAWRTVKMHWLAFRLGRAVVSFLQRTGLYPPGVTDAMDTIKEAIDGVRAGGELGIFSPAWWFVGTLAAPSPAREEGEGRA